jgi:release factor glutamine methyltransferase
METLALTRGHAETRVLEIGTGSGCVAVTLARRQPGLTVTTVDISLPATEIARQNAERHAVADRVVFLAGDAFDALPAGERFDLVVSNPPYVPHDEIAQLDPDVRLHEPHLALDGGADGVDMIRRLIADAPDYLTPGGHLLFEIGYEQGAAACGLLTEDGRYTDVRIIKDLSKHDRVAAARLA